MPLQDGERGVSALTWHFYVPHGITILSPRAGPRSHLQGPLSQGSRWLSHLLCRSSARLMPNLRSTWMLTWCPEIAENMTPSLYLRTGNNDVIFCVNPSRVVCRHSKESGITLGRVGSQSPFLPPHLWNATSWFPRGHLCPWLNQGTEPRPGPPLFTVQPTGWRDTRPGPNPVCRFQVKVRSQRFLLFYRHFWKEI